MNRCTQRGSDLRDAQERRPEQGALSELPVTLAVLNVRPTDSSVLFVLIAFGLGPRSAHRHKRLQPEERELAGQAGRHLRCLRTELVTVCALLRLEWASDPMGNRPGRGADTFVAVAAPVTLSRPGCVVLSATFQRRILGPWPVFRVA